MKSEADLVLRGERVVVRPYRAGELDEAFRQAERAESRVGELSRERLALRIERSGRFVEGRLDLAVEVEGRLVDLGAGVVGGQARICAEAGLQGHGLQPGIGAHQVHALAVAIGVALQKPEAHGALEGAGPLWDHEGHLILKAEIPQPID